MVNHCRRIEMYHLWHNETKSANNKIVVLQTQTYFEIE